MVFRFWQTPSPQDTPKTRLDVEKFLEDEAARSGYELLTLVCNPEIARDLQLSATQTRRFQGLATELLDDVEATAKAARGAKLAAGKAEG